MIIRENLDGTLCIYSFMKTGFDISLVKSNNVSTIDYRKHIIELITNDVKSYIDTNLLTEDEISKLYKMYQSDTNIIYKKLKEERLIYSRRFKLNQRVIYKGKYKRRSAIIVDKVKCYDSEPQRYYIKVGDHVKEVNYNEISEDNSPNLNISEDNGLSKISTKRLLNMLKMYRKSYFKGYCHIEFQQIKRELSKREHIKRK